MKKIAAVACAVIAGLLLAGVAAAADQPTFTTVKTPDLIGKQVRNSAGTVLGKVDDYVISIKDGTLVYGVLHYGDTLGFGGKLFAVPPQALALSGDQKYVVLDADKNDLDGAAGFDANRWPTAADERWGKHGNAPKKDDNRKDDKKDDAKKDDANKPPSKDDENKAMHLRRVTSLVGTAVKNERAEDLGTVQGFAFNMKDNKVIYAAMSYGGVAGIGSKYFAIPFEALKFESPTLKAGDKAFLVDYSKEELEKAPGFDPKNWPTEADSRFRTDKKDPNKKP